MEKMYKLGKLDGLTISARGSVIPAFLVLWIVLSAIGVGLLKLPLGSSILVGLLAVLGHYFSALLHQLGHAWAARRTGYPMEGVRFWGYLSTSFYPANEGNLPASIHIRRAVGGPFFSLLASVLLFAIILVLRGSTSVAWYIAIFLFVINLVLFVFGSLIPLGFTDGSTLLYWLPKREKI